MTIKTRLQVTVVIAILLALGISSFIFFVDQRLNGVIEESRRTDEIVRGVFELNILTNDYLLRRNERTTDQWWSEHGFISRILIDAGASEDSKKQERLGILRENHKSIGTTFFQLVSVPGTISDEERSTVFRELEDRLVSQLVARSQTMVASTLTLARENRRELTRQQQQLSLFVLAAIFILAATIATSSLLTMKRVLKPLLKLQEGADIIGEGNFKYRIDVKSKDEIGQLAMSFNVAAAELQISYSKLKKQIKELKDLDRLKDNFLNNTTHELKTPLIPIKSQAQLLLLNTYGKLNTEQKESVEMILRNEEHLRGLVTDVMNISKLYSKKMTFVFKPSELAPIIEEVVGDMTEAAKAKGVTLILNPIPELPTLSLDAKRITQVVSNLLNNALKFTSPKAAHLGGQAPEVTVEVRKGKDNVVVSVTDNGIGISEKTLAKLFTPFLQAESDAARKYPGTGLGLSICKGFVEGHGGTIQAASPGQGKGATFTFTLPYPKG